MLKAMQILGSSSGFVSHKLKPLGNCGLFLVSISSRSPTKSNCSMTPNFSVRKARCFRAFRVSCARSESKPDVTSSSSVTFQSTGHTRKVNFCQLCGGSTKHEIPDGKEKMRAVCTLCMKIAYENPPKW